ncbi:hypothetical protein [Microbacterium sp. p3-SID131]|uniref:hypothetical protein n=1 Tax=Microbacterium sp. p3-SID131 TaxID=2916215 RepID=UPI0021A6BADD|nr:hypothetical protein [Microbacterium sp. p3-SID131]MCT1363349.1 hypothetical protein [Microbacterium sp. p3-SID131]
MGHKPTVGLTAANSQFAQEITRYLEHVRARSGVSVRKVSEQPASKRANSWWAEIFNGKKILTTSDIDWISTDLLGITPFRLIEYARLHAEGSATPPVRFYVGDLDDDVNVLTQEEESFLRQSELELAAYRGRNEADKPHAE